MTHALIVDDNADNIYLLRSLLQGYGYTVDEARDGQEALFKARDHTPDLTVSDLMMPVMDGYSLLREWRADAQLRTIPFIVYTATYTDPKDERLAMDLGADAFLIKPAEPDSFMHCVREVLTQAMSKRTATQPHINDRETLEEHSAALVRKLAKKARLLDESNRELRSENKERKQTEAALRESEDRYRRLFHAIGDPLFVYDRDTLAYLDVNEAAVESYGYSREEFLTMTIKDIRPSEDVDALLNMLEQSGAGRERRGIWRHRKKNGDLIEVEISTYGVEYGGRPACVAHARDVTERRRAEAEVVQTMTLLQAVANGTSDAVFVKDLDGKYLLFNRAAARLVGKPVAEVLGNDDTNIWNTADARKVMANDRVVIDTQQSQSVEETLFTNGSVRTLHAVKVPYRDLDGNILGVIGISRDVTERKRVEEALLLRDRAIQAVSQGILITDASHPEHPIVYASAGFTRMTQYGIEEVLGRNCRFLQGKDTDQETVGELRDAIAAKRSCSVEILNYRKDGTSFWNHLEISPVWDAQGRATHFVGVQTDITERRRLEVQFRQAQKMEAIGRLAGGVAHDFNNLLTVINVYSSILLGQVSPDDQMAEPLSEIRKAGERAGALTRQLLVFSRQQVLESKLMSVGALVRDTESMLRRLIGEDIILVTTLSNEPDWVKADPGQIVQVLLNFAVNARDAMPTGGCLTIETQSARLDEVYCSVVGDLQPGDYILLSVSDNGTGMEESVQARIFEPFFTTKDVGKGTGLGLPTVHGIIRQSRGHVSVYSEVGVGTTFKVYIPRVQGPASSIPKAEALLAMPAGSETILLVEDEDAVRELAAQILRECGYCVLVAANGRDAVCVSEGHLGPIHVLISDVVMPYLSGRGVAEQIYKKRPECRVLFLSGYTNDAVIRHGVLEAEFNFLQKPFTALSLAQKVREILDASSDAKAPTS